MDVRHIRLTVSFMTQTIVGYTHCHKDVFYDVDDIAGNDDFKKMIRKVSGMMKSYNYSDVTLDLEIKDDGFNHKLFYRVCADLDTKTSDIVETHHFSTVHYDSEHKKIARSMIYKTAMQEIGKALADNKAYSNIA